MMVIGKSNEIFLSSMNNFQYCLSIQMPIMLGLTVRAAKQKKLPPKIPKSPMFHDDPHLEEDVPEDIQEDHQNSEEIQPQIPLPQVIFVKPAPDLENHI